MFSKINTLGYAWLQLTSNHITISSNKGHFILKIISVSLVVKVLVSDNI